jgi:hypothetical protein
MQADQSQNERDQIDDGEKKLGDGIGDHTS